MFCPKDGSNVIRVKGTAAKAGYGIISQYIVLRFIGSKHRQTSYVVFFSQTFSHSENKNSPRFDFQRPSYSSSSSSSGCRNAAPAKCGSTICLFSLVLLFVSPRLQFLLRVCFISFLSYLIFYGRALKVYNGLDGKLLKCALFKFEVEKMQKVFLHFYQCLNVPILKQLLIQTCHL